MALLLTLYGPKPQTGQPDTPDRPNKNIVWLSTPGPGGGGGGGGNQMKEPPRKVELPGKEKITVPATKLPEVAADAQAPGSAEGRTGADDTRQDARRCTADRCWRHRGHEPQRDALSGHGDERRGGDGLRRRHRPGAGFRSRPGLRWWHRRWGLSAGERGASCRACSGRSGPTTRPTRCARRCREPSGSRLSSSPTERSGRLEVVRSLDSTFGLDEEALKAAKQWRFAPGTRFGQAVAVLVTIELTFTLR